MPAENTLSPRMCGILLVIAFLWGFSEATVFFIVPDVFLTAIVILSFRLAFQAVFAAWAGAMLGGSCAYFFAVHAPELARKVLETVPWISPSLIEKAALQYQQHGAFSMLSGGFSGMPYKIYAWYAGSQQLDFAAFLFMGAGARWLRFTCYMLIMAGIVKLLRRWLSTTQIYGVWFSACAALYAIYWSMMPF